VRCAAGTLKCPSDLDVLSVSSETGRPASAKPLIRPGPIGGNNLVRDYLSETPAALRYYTGSPFRLDSFRGKAAEVNARFGPDERARAAMALRPTSDAARTRLDRFVREGGLFVTTGQQTGFLTGPLYTIYKAVSAVVLARHLEERLGTTVLPVFWAASEDHDWAEVNHTFLLNPGGRLRRFDLPAGDPRPLPMSERRLDGDLDALCDEILQYVGGQQHTRDYLRKIIDQFRVSGRTVAAAFREGAAAMLSRFDVLIADAADPVLKQTSFPTLKRALVDAVAQEEALVERSRKIEEAGYSRQVSILEGATNVFVHGERGRERLQRRAGGFAVRGRKAVYEPQALLREVESEPTRFSPNVLLRPVVEGAVFPTIAYIGGPGEIAYLAQAGAIFEGYGILPPVAVPRFSGVVMEAATERTLSRLGMTQADLADSREQLIDRLARREMPASAIRSLTRIREDLVSGFDRLADEVEGIDPTLVDSLGAIRNRLLISSGRAERKIVRSVKRGEKLATAQLDRVLDSLRPNGKLQDRVLNVLPFLARYGDHFLAEVERAITESWRLPDEG
jgi:bacillithiol biosynthesis cysteine-adding enzyme BshC